MNDKHHARSFPEKQGNKNSALKKYPWTFDKRLLYFVVHSKKYDSEPPNKVVKMISFQPILLKVWQEACRHIEIDQSCVNISRLLHEHLPLAQILVRTLDPSRQMLETVALGIPVMEIDLPKASDSLKTEQWKILTRELKRKAVFLLSEDTQSKEIFQWLIPVSEQRDVLAGRLESNRHPKGILILISRAGQTFTARHCEIMQALLEPFSVALENDARLKELATLREAAEADKKQLLQRLYRKEMVDTVVGMETGLRMVLNRVELVARSDVPVMILGETGTGKELIAREIHRRSGRAEGPFIRINCGAIPPDLIDSQLFGHEKGAFTGAVATHHGWFERAHGGTLFLDEIGELAHAGQVRLLRVLQDGWLERVGGKQPIHVDVRTVVATHRDLAERVQQGTFREDLWYRLNVFPILLPALRDRLEDIPDLARHFAERAALRFCLPHQLPTEEDIRILASYSWPGNIRELASVIDRAAILGNGEGLQTRKALGWIDKNGAPERRAFSGESNSRFPSLDQVVIQHIEQALRKSNGRVEGRNGAAELLGLHPNTLRAKMRKLSVTWTQFREQ